MRELLVEVHVGMISLALENGKVVHIQGGFERNTERLERLLDALAKLAEGVERAVENEAFRDYRTA